MKNLNKRVFVYATTENVRVVMKHLIIKLNAKNVLKKRENKKWQNIMKERIKVFARCVE